MGALDCAKNALFFFALGNDQRDTRDERDSACDGRQRNGPLLSRCDLEGPDIHQLLPGCIAYPLIGQGQHSRNDQNNACKFHRNDASLHVEKTAARTISRKKAGAVHIQIKGQRPGR